MSSFRNVVIFGATGETGHFLVKEALKSGYNVRAAVRTPSKLKIEHEHLHVCKSDIYDETSVSEAIAGQDVVLASLAPKSFSLTEATDIFTQTAKAIIPAMKQHNVSRLLVISTSARRGISWDNHPIFEFVIKRIFWRTLYSNVVAMDEIVMASNLEWTMIRPPQVKNEPYRGKYRIGEGLYALPRGAIIGRADLAEAMVSLIDKPSSFRNNVAIAY